VNVSLKVSMEGDSSREMSFTLEPLHEGVENGTWITLQQNGLGVHPTTGHWTYDGTSGEVWLSENSDVFTGVRVDADWSRALVGGTTVMGQGWMQRTSQGDINVLFTMEATS